MRRFFVVFLCFLPLGPFIIITHDPCGMGDRLWLIVRCAYGKRERACDGDVIGARVAQPKQQTHHRAHNQHSSCWVSRYSAFYAWLFLLPSRRSARSVIQEWVAFYDAASATRTANWAQIRFHDHKSKPEWWCCDYSCNKSAFWMTIIYFKFLKI